MKQLVEYELEDGGTIIVEVDLPEAGIERASRGDQIIKAKERFGEAFEQINRESRYLAFFCAARMQHQEWMVSARRSPSGTQGGA